MDFLHQFLLPITLLVPCLSVLLLLCTAKKLVHYQRRIVLSSLAISFIIILYLLKALIVEKQLNDFDVSLISIAFSLFTAESESINVIIPMQLGLDHFNVWLLFFTTISIAIAAFAGIYVKKRQRFYYILLQLLQIIANFIIMSQQAFWIWSSFALMAIVFFYLIGVWADEQHEQTAIRFIKAQILGIILIGIGIFMLTFNVLGGDTGFSISFHNASLHEQIEQYIYLNANEIGYRILVFGFIIAGFLCLVPVIGLHKWFIDVFKRSHYAVLVLIAGVYLPLIFSLWKQWLYGYFIDFIPYIQNVAIWVMAAQFLLASLLMWRQTELRAWLGYIIWGQSAFGYILLQTLDLSGLTFAFTYIFSLSLISCLLLFIAAAMQERFGKDDMVQLKGILKTSPYMGSCLIIALLALLGIPLFSHFMPLFHTMLLSFEIVPAVTLAIGIAYVIFAGAILKQVNNSSKDGVLEFNKKTVSELRFFEVLPIMLLITFIILIGIYPYIFTDQLEVYAEEMLNLLAGYKEVVTWNPTSFSFLIFGEAFTHTWQYTLASFIAVALLLTIWFGSKKSNLLLTFVLWNASYCALFGLGWFILGPHWSYAEFWKDFAAYSVSVLAVFIGLHFLLSRHMNRSGYQDAKDYTGLYYKNGWLAVIFSLLLLSLSGAPFFMLGYTRATLLAQLFFHKYMFISILFMFSLYFMIKPIFHWLAHISFVPENRTYVLLMKEQIEDWKWTSIEKYLVGIGMVVCMVLPIIFVLF